MQALHFVAREHLFLLCSDPCQISPLRKWELGTKTTRPPELLLAPQEGPNGYAHVEAMEYISLLPTCAQMDHTWAGSMSSTQGLPLRPGHPHPPGKWRWGRAISEGGRGGQGWSRPPFRPWGGGGRLPPGLKKKTARSAKKKSFKKMPKIVFSGDFFPPN